MIAIVDSERDDDQKIVSASERVIALTSERMIAIVPEAGGRWTSNKAI